MGRYDDWFEKKTAYEKEQIEKELRNRDWKLLNEHEKGQLYERNGVL